MADWSVEVQETAPVVTAEIVDIKLFGRWSSADVEVKDIGLQDYIAVKVRRRENHFVDLISQSHSEANSR